jgi:nitrogen fixation/metabolism regulation signal transduction histidine kinase
MVMRTFEFRLILRVLLLAISAVLFAFLVLNRDFLFAAMAIALLIMYQIYSLIYFAAKTNRDLSRFLLSIKYDDISQAFTSEGLGSSFSELKEAFGQVMSKLKETRSEMEVHARYLDTIIQHVGIGLLAYKPDGAVALINNGAKKLLRVAALSDINSMRPVAPELVNTLLSLKHGDKKLIRIPREGEAVYFSISAHTFLLREEKYILVSIQNIQAELEEKEMEAWQNLIRVLTHEIMNSITPISSMTGALLDMLNPSTAHNSPGADEIGPEEIEEMADALKTIHQRSQGLMNFVNSYRNMALIPTPQFQLLSISEFFRRMEKLMSPKMTEGGIAFRWSVEPETLELTADPDLMEQVMINLLFNAIQAVSGCENPCIALSAFLNPESNIVISVEDNGVGIVEEALEKIFIPFFTTKKQGSGIGLSLSRRILHLHNATISVKSKPDQGTLFTLKFG